MRTATTIGIALSISFLVHAGGDPEYVKFPAGYQTKFAQYDILNRANGKQLAVLYANTVARDSAASGKLATGSKIIMEIYKAKLGDDGRPIMLANDLFEKGKFAAVAVMEKRTDWDPRFAATARAADWGFALYNPDGTTKENDLPCASCHIPMPENDYLFSFPSLVESTQ